MVFKQKSTRKRAYVRFLVKFKGTSTKLNGQCEDQAVRKKVTGRPWKLSDREQ